WTKPATAPIRPVVEHRRTFTDRRVGARGQIRIGSIRQGKDMSPSVYRNCPAQPPASSPKLIAASVPACAALSWRTCHFVRVGAVGAAVDLREVKPPGVAQGAQVGEHAGD